MHSTAERATQSFDKNPDLQGLLAVSSNLNSVKHGCTIAALMAAQIGACFILKRAASKQKFHVAQVTCHACAFEAVSEAVYQPE